MRQYLEVKARYPDAIVLFRLGDFYEMFYEDAVYVARALNLTLTTRDKGKEDPVPMCGVPHHAVRGYLNKLTELGHRVALCEQLEDPRNVRGIVKRDVVRVVTPGVVLDEESLDPRAPSYVAAAVGEARGGYGLAYLDVTTGDFRATEAPSIEALCEEIGRVAPRELVFGRRDADRALVDLVRAAHPRVARAQVDDGDPAVELPRTLGAAFDPGLLDSSPRAAAAIAAVLRYARATQPGAELPLRGVEITARTDTLVIDEQARAHLELAESLLDRRRSGSLIEVLDQTRTAMGGRLLRRWLLFPSVDLATIRRRHDAVERLVGAHAARDRARQLLGEVADLERLVGRARLGVATPRDLAVLGRSLSLLPAVAEALYAAHEVELRGSAAGETDLLRLSGADDDAGTDDDLGAELAAELVRVLRPDAPALAREGGYVNPGVSAELDGLRDIASGGRDRIAAIETRERERTGIPSLKIKFNNVFGYYIEITRSHLAAVPADYRRKQTVANAERFVTTELGEFEQTVLSADERRITMELAIFEALRARVAATAERLLALAGRVATADTLAALAEVAHRGGYCRPEVDQSGIIDLTDARHPVVERLAAAGSFVPNDVRLDPAAEQILIVSGPNMAGKSTLMRQVALAVIQAQMGGFVAARAARIGLVDRIFTRVGAGDNLARGESTFMVEMRETAHILRYATAKSLIVLDEIGRGTSTYDGVSIAWAVAEHLHDRVGAKTLFATHYHELAALAAQHPRVRNVSVAAREWKGEVVFLRKLTPGGTSRSFGVEVARLAGLPPPVVARARAILRTLEAPPVQGRAGISGSSGSSDVPRPVAPDAAEAGDGQLGLFEPPTAAALAALAGIPAASLIELVERLRDLDPDELSPRAAHALLAELVRKLTPLP
ncbi:MAG TPA: DNA mismatch repair protein MutS [Polyangia bacterium]|nr:DNA mismatch repair protein MutS [Polyangia bacterium]